MFTYIMYISEIMYGGYKNLAYEQDLIYQEVYKKWGYIIVQIVIPLVVLSVLNILLLLQVMRECIF